MKILNLIPLLFLPLLMGFVEILSTHTETSLLDESELKSISMKVIKKRLRLSGTLERNASYMTDIRFGLQTYSVGGYGSFGVVQFIRGCKWRSTWDGKQVVKDASISRHHMGQIITFKHVGFEIDSDSLDPLYHSYLGHRFALWRWNEKPSNDNPETAYFVYHREPSHGTVFLTDLPGTSFFSAELIEGKQWAQNSSLEFKTCLFRLADLPLQTDPQGSNIDQAKALKCFSWDDKWVYDFQKGLMTSPAEIDSFCR